MPEDENFTFEDQETLSLTKVEQQNELLKAVLVY